MNISIKTPITNPTSMKYLIYPSSRNGMVVHQDANAKNIGGIGKIKKELKSLVFIDSYFLNWTIQGSNL